ncbi:MAG TPA: hypothetical protein VNW52_13440 [Burkholderiaceae bacterium]|nr:hypothetical protein [Burkholderiaceae bacterium]
MKSLQFALAFTAMLCIRPAYGDEQLVTSAYLANGETIPYILTTAGDTPKFVTILMPGGVGRLEPHMEDGKLRFLAGGNFLIRSRVLFADDDFATVSTDATGSAERMQAIVDDVQSRFPGAQIYIVGTSRSTFSTMQLAVSLDGKVAGFIHTSPMDGIYSFDTRNFKSRHLLVLHRDDSCRATHPSSAIHAHEKFGIPLIVMEGGVSTGDPCEAAAYHGYNGIESETVNRIKTWIRAAP